MGGCILSCFVPLHISDFNYKSHIPCRNFQETQQLWQRERPSTLDRQEGEYKHLMEAFSTWCRLSPPNKHFKHQGDDTLGSPGNIYSITVCIKGVSVALVQTCKNLDLQLGDKLDWSTNMDMLYRKGQIRLGPFSLYNKLLQIFYPPIFTNICFYAVDAASKRQMLHVWTRLLGKVALWSSRAGQLNICGREKDPQQTSFHLSNNIHYPMQRTVISQRGVLSGRLLSLSCSMERLRKSVLPHAPAM